MNISELLEQFARNRSETVFCVLMRGYINLVYSIAQRRLGDATQVEEVVQDVFIRLAGLDKLPSTETELIAWFHATTHRVSIDRWRKDTRRQNRETKAAEMTPPDSHSEPPWQNLAPVLDDALAELDAGEREALLLRYFQDEPFKVVAQTLGVSDGAAKMRVGRALDKLRAKLALRGIACSSVALGVMLDRHAVGAAPAILLDRASAVVRRSAFAARRELPKKSRRLLSPKVLVPGLVLVTAFWFWRNWAHSARIRERMTLAKSGTPARAFVPLTIRNSPLPGTQAAAVNSTEDLMARLRLILDQARAVKQYPPNELLQTLLECKDSAQETLAVLVEYLRSPDYETRHWAVEGLKVLTQAGGFKEVKAAARLALMRVVVSPHESEALRQDAFFSGAVSHDYASASPIKGSIFSEPIADELLQLFATSFQEKGADMVSYVGGRGVILASYLAQTKQNVDGYRQVLESTLVSGDSNQRFAAAIALAGLPGDKAPQVKAELIRLLQTDTWTLPQNSAAVGLGQLGSEAADALPALAEYVERKKDDPAGRGVAKTAIRSIQMAMNGSTGDPLVELSPEEKIEMPADPPADQDSQETYYKQLVEELRDPEKRAAFVPEERRIQVFPYWAVDSSRQARDDVAAKADPEIAELIRRVPVELHAMEDQPEELEAKAEPGEFIGRALGVAERPDNGISAQSLARVKALLAQDQSLLRRAGDYVAGTSRADKLVEVARTIGLIDPKLYQATVKSFLDNNPGMDRLLIGTAPKPPPDTKPGN